MDGVDDDLLILFFFSSCNSPYSSIDVFNVDKEKKKTRCFGWGYLRDMGKYGALNRLMKDMFMTLGN